MSTLSIRLFAPEQIQDAVDDVLSVVSTIMQTMEIRGKPGAESVYEQAVALFNQKSGNLERLIRSDLGAD